MPKLSFDYKKVLLKLASHVSTYRVIITALALCSLFAFTILRINGLSNPDVDQTKLNEQISSLKKVNFNNDAIEKIQALVDSGVEIDANFDPNRSNPFSN